MNRLKKPQGYLLRNGIDSQLDMALYYFGFLINTKLSSQIDILLEYETHYNILEQLDSTWNNYRL